MALFTSLFIIVVVLWGLVRYLEMKVIFYPSKDIVQTPAVLGLSFEDLYVITSDKERINAWFIKAGQGASTIIFAHGNAGTMGDRLLKLKYLHELGLNVLMFDYRGYGRSSGHPDEAGIYLDGQAAFDYIASRVDIDPKRIIMYGSSLGGVVAVDVASKRPCTALIVDSSITSAKDVAKIYYPYLPAFLMRTKFDSIGKIKNIKIPKLIIHSPRDNIIPYFMGVRLFEAACEPKTFLRSTGSHNEIQVVTDRETRLSFEGFLRTQQLL